MGSSKGAIPGEVLQRVSDMPFQADCEVRFTSLIVGLGSTLSLIALMSCMNESLGKEAEEILVTY
jgi:hypothetical protein